MSIRGSLDAINSEGASGWAYESARGKPLLVQAMLGHEVLGEAVADEYRSDIASIGLAEGKCGYAIAFHRPIDPLYLPFIVVKPESGDVELPRYSRSTFVEFFAALYRAYPAAGRNRSALGGLWTDRTDSAAQLKGKVEIGLINPDTGKDVGQLIHQGLAVVEGLAENLPRAIKASAYPQAATTLLGGGHVLRLLRAVLEDYPVVFEAATVGVEDTPLIQPSAEAGALLSPTECLAVLAPLGADVLDIDVVRDSHLFPEFTRDGISRWTSAAVCGPVEIPALEHGLLDRYSIKPGTAVVIGPGLFYSVRKGEGGSGLRLLVAAARGIPARFAQEGRKQIVKDEFRVCLGK